MANINLELRLKRFGSIFSESVFLEDATNPGREVTGWIPMNDFRFVRLSGFVVNDGALDVFLGCVGNAGGTVTCEVLVENQHIGDVVARAEDRNFAHQSFPLNQAV